MVMAQPGQGGLLPERTAPHRGTLATTACMETLQAGYLHAVVIAAAGCSLSQPLPDDGMHGRLESRGGFRRLTGAAGVAPVQVDDAERDRLMKALQENLDCFEEACGGDDD